MSKEIDSNPYDILNISEDANDKEIRARYFSLSRTFHPDKQPAELFSDTSKYFEKVESSYKILITPITRYIYDNYGMEGEYYYRLIIL